MIHQGIHNIPPTEKQKKHYLNTMHNPENQNKPVKPEQPNELQKKIAILEKQLAWEKLRTDALDTMINIAEK